MQGGRRKGRKEEGRKEIGEKGRRNSKMEEKEPR
jgi:hypothetical protein